MEAESVGRPELHVPSAVAYKGPFSAGGHAIGVANKIRGHLRCVVLHRNRGSTESTKQKRPLRRRRSLLRRAMLSKRIFKHFQEEERIGVTQPAVEPQDGSSFVCATGNNSCAKCNVTSKVGIWRRRQVAEVRTSLYGWPRRCLLSVPEKYLDGFMWHSRVQSSTAAINSHTNAVLYSDMLHTS